MDIIDIRVQGLGYNSTWIYLLDIRTECMQTQSTKFVCASDREPLHHGDGNVSRKESKICAMALNMLRV